MNRSSFVSKLFTPVITLLVLAYFGYQIYGYVSDPFSTTLAYTYEVEESMDLSGYVVRQEQVITDSSGSSGNTELVFHHLDEFRDFEDGLGRDCVKDFFIGKGHFQLRITLY